MVIADKHTQKNHKHYFYDNNDNSVLNVVETQRLNQHTTKIEIKSQLRQKH